MPVRQFYTHEEGSEISPEVPGSVRGGRQGSRQLRVWDRGQIKLRLFYSGPRSFLLELSCRGSQPRRLGHQTIPSEELGL